MSEEVRTQLSAGVSSDNTPFLRRIGGQAQLTVIGSNGDKVRFNVSEDTARSFEKTAAQVRSESLQQTTFTITDDCLSLTLPSGKIFQGDTGNKSLDTDKDFWKGSMFEKE